MTTVLNTMTGIVNEQPDHLVDHVIIGRYLLVVPEGTKNLVPGMFKPGTADEFAALNSPKEPEAGKPAKANNNPEKNGDK